MDFVKMEGLGNDFVVLEGPRSVSIAEVTAWCDRRTGIGADGVLVVSPVDESSVRMEYWNSDGSEAEICGNGLRCVSRLARDRQLVGGASFTVLTSDGAKQVEVRQDGSVRALLGIVTQSAEPVEMVGYRFELADIGNPHAIAFVKDTYSVPVSTVGPVVEGDPVFPNRTNVEFATVVGRSRIALRVWERGSGETLACGTGAAATAAVAHRLGRTNARSTVMLPGGPLEVEVTDDGVWIEGPARYVFDGTLR